MCSNVFSMFAGYCGHANKNHIYTVLTVIHNSDIALSKKEFDTPEVQQNERRLRLALYLTSSEMV